MRILYSTFSFFPARNGVARASSHDVAMLRQLGHEVDVLTTDDGFECLTNPSQSDSSVHKVAFRGNGALWNPLRGDRAKLNRFIAAGQWDLAVLAGWQNWATDAVLPLLRRVHPGMPVFLRSHGMSVNTRTVPVPFWLIRYAGWRHYLWFRVPRIVSSLTGLIVLLDHEDNDRFLDVRLARLNELPVHELPNVAPSFSISLTTTAVASPRRHFLCVGNFSYEKNERFVLEAYRQSALHRLPLIFVGPRDTRYARSLRRRILELKLDNCSLLFDPSDLDLQKLYESSIAVLSGSRAECQPLALLDAMHFGIPFISTPVGAVPSLKGGLLASTPLAMARAMGALNERPELWTDLSAQGRSCAQARHSTAEATRRWKQLFFIHEGRRN